MTYDSKLYHAVIKLLLFFLYHPLDLYVKEVKVFSASSCKFIMINHQILKIAIKIKFGRMCQMLHSKQKSDIVKYFHLDKYRTCKNQLSNQFFIFLRFKVYSCNSNLAILIVTLLIGSLLVDLRPDSIMAPRHRAFFHGGRGA